MGEQYLAALACLLIGLVVGHWYGRREAKRETEEARAVARLVIEELSGEVAKLRERTGQSGGGER